MCTCVHACVCAYEGCAIGGSNVMMLTSIIQFIVGTLLSFSLFGVVVSVIIALYMVSIYYAILLEQALKLNLL